MKKFTNEELRTMALEVYKEFENEIPEEKKRRKFPFKYSKRIIERHGQVHRKTSRK